MRLVYLVNRLPTKALDGIVPIEAWSGHKPSVSHLRVFGCLAYAHIPKTKRKKLDDRSRKCVFLGYASSKKGYGLMDLLRQTVFTSKDVRFEEHIFLSGPSRRQRLQSRWSLLRLTFPTMKL